MALALVGSAVGPVGTDESEAAASLMDAGQGYDYAIGGLGFRLAVSDERPYERATAQFRKDQFDTTQKVGDQSLVGWWTRGQLSFHKGAGVRYYETLDGDVVENRFLTATGADITTPGAVTCVPNLTADLAGTDYTWGGATFTDIAVLDGSTVKHGTTSLTAYTPTSGTATCLAAGPNVKYVGTSTARIDKFTTGVGTHTFTLPFNATHLWYAKDRLWVICRNASGSDTLYQLAPTPATPPVTVTDTEKVFTAGDSWGGNWLLCDTPGAVLLGNGSRIFAVTVGTDGVVPTVEAPIQVAELPAGEVIMGMLHSLGYVVLATSAGLRVGVVGDAGQVTYGPLLAEVGTATPTQTTLAATGSSVFVPLDGNLYRVDLAHQVGQGLEFSWTVHASLPGIVGVFVDKDRTLRPFTASSIYTETPGEFETATLTTGYHRFGTLEMKKFHLVRVRVAGTQGTVAVGRVDPNGVVVPLYTMNVADTAGDDITLNMDDPAEMVGLSFTLTPGTTEAPILLGYQLRALPAPKRQRLIRVPLMLQDVERRGTARSTGRATDAYRRLSQLEAMESTGGTFTYQDFRTGEAGQCYIEQIEHRGTTPPGRQDAGFGGVVWVTLRALG